MNLHAAIIECHLINAPKAAQALERIAKMAAKKERAAQAAKESEAIEWFSTMLEIYDPSVTPSYEWLNQLGEDEGTPENDHQSWETFSNGFEI